MIECFFPLGCFCQSIFILTTAGVGMVTNKEHWYQEVWILGFELVCGRDQGELTAVHYKAK